MYLLWIIAKSNWHKNWYFGTNNFAKTSIKIGKIAH
jgi:hypothetical protein